MCSSLRNVSGREGWAWIGDPGFWDLSSTFFLFPLLDVIRGLGKSWQNHWNHTHVGGCLPRVLGIREMETQVVGLICQREPRSFLFIEESSKTASKNIINLQGICPDIPSFARIAQHQELESSKLVWGLRRRSWYRHFRHGGWPSCKSTSLDYKTVTLALRFPGCFLVIMPSCHLHYIHIWIYNSYLSTAMLVLAHCVSSMIVLLCPGAEP